MEQIKILKNPLVKEYYILIGDLLLLLLPQCTGIPIGNDAALFWSNLYLHGREVDFFSHLIKANKPRVIKFNNVSCLIDDECN